MKYKAKYIGSTKIDQNYLEMMFEYRGKTYFVTRALNWSNCSSDYTISGAKSERKQHEQQQKIIDDSFLIPKTEPAKYDDTNEKAFYKLLDYFDGNDNAFD